MCSRCAGWSAIWQRPALAGGSQASGAAHCPECRQPGDLVGAGGGSLRAEQQVLLELVVEDQEVGLKRMRAGEVAACVCAASVRHGARIQIIT